MVHGREASTTRTLHNQGHQMTLTSSIIGRFKLVIVTAFMLGTLTTVSQAYTLEQEEMCSGDAMRLCSSEIPNVARITACMERQRDSLSDGCKAVFETDTPPAAATSPAKHTSAAKPTKPMDLTPKFKRS
jgi:hypothetical protein